MTTLILITLALVLPSAFLLLVMLAARPVKG